jgi:hypothetical protein
MRREIDKIGVTQGQLPEALDEFLKQMRQLLDVADAEKNPIVFV